MWKDQRLLAVDTETYEKGKIGKTKTNMKMTSFVACNCKSKYWELNEYRREKVRQQNQYIQPRTSQKQENMYCQQKRLILKTIAVQNVQKQNIRSENGFIF